MLKITPAEACRVTRLRCYACRERLPRVGLKENSHIEGLTFTCAKCGKVNEVDTKEEN
jgi:transcription initiation factor IIE alpha subunit